MPIGQVIDGDNEC